MKRFLSLAITLLGVSQSLGQVVQLPAVSSFGVNTTVSVPDQGMASLGGVGRSSYGMTTRGAGPLASSTRGGSASATSASISATVIDLAAMDEAILNMPADSKNVPRYATRNQGTKIVNTLTPHRYSRDIKQRPAAPLPYEWMAALGPQANDQLEPAEAKVLDGSNTRYFMEKAASAHAQGHAAAARVFYKMALDRMTPAQQQRLQEIRTNRDDKAAGKSKKGQDDSKTVSAATPSTAPAADSDSASSPFAPLNGEPGAKTDMNDSPF